MGTYYNTTDERGSDLERSRLNASIQEEKVLQYFKDNPGINLAANEVHQKLFKESIPKTSVRRCFTALKDAGLIIKTDYVVIL